VPSGATGLENPKFWSLKGFAAKVISIWFARRRRNRFNVGEMDSNSSSGGFWKILTKNITFGKGLADDPQKLHEK